MTIHYHTIFILFMYKTKVVLRTLRGKGTIPPPTVQLFTETQHME